MAENSRAVRFTNKINGIEVGAPTNWQELTFTMTFDGDSIEANVSSNEMEFTLEEADTIRTHIEDGLNGGVGIFEGIPYEIGIENKDSAYSSFVGYIDCSDGLEDDTENNRVKVQIKKSKSITTLSEKMEGLSFGYIEYLGRIKKSDYTTIEYVVEREITLLENLVNGGMVYMFYSQGAQLIKENGDLIVEVTAFNTQIPAGTVGGLIMLIGKTILQLAANLIFIDQAVSLGRKLVNTYIPPKREAKAIKLRTALDRLFEFMGYKLETNIADLDTLYYLPSNPNSDEMDILGNFKRVKGTEKGIPYIEDYGYNALDFMQLVNSLFNTKLLVTEDKRVLMYNEFDSYWDKMAAVTIPSTLPYPKTYNTKEMVRARKVSFQTDTTDIHTVNNFTGTNYLVVTDPIKENNVEANFITGLDEINVNVCLGNRKNTLTNLENSLLEIFTVIDNFINALGGNSKLSDKITNKIGVLKIEQNNYAKPKLLKMVNGRIPMNHRDTCSAKYFYQFHSGKSFFANNYYGQKVYFRDIRIPLSMEDFLTMIKNRKCITQDGKIAEIENGTYYGYRGYAMISGYVREPYTKNLKETHIEP